MHTRVLDCCHGCEQCDCRASSIGWAVEGCARGSFFSRIQTSIMLTSLDRHRWSRWRVASRRWIALILPCELASCREVRLQLSDVSMRTPWKSPNVWTPGLAKVWSRTSHSHKGDSMLYVRGVRYMCIRHSSRKTTPNNCL